MKNLHPIQFMIILLSLFTFFRCKESAKPQLQEKESASDGLSAYQADPSTLFPVRIKGKWGYINRKGDLILQPSWDEAEEFNEGTAQVKVLSGSESKYGFIDSIGQWVVQPAYESAGSFSEGLAFVSKNGLFGYINTKGEEVIPCQFEAAANFWNGYAAIKQNGWTGFINPTGAIVVEPQFTVSVSHPRFNEHLAPVFGPDEKTGFIDPAGHFKIEPLYASAGCFKEGKAWAMIQSDDPEAQYGFTIKGGFIDTIGTYVIPPEYDFGWDFSEGYATVWVRSEDKTSKIWKVIDGDGEVVLDQLPYRNVGSLNAGLIPVQNEELKWGFIDLQGKEIIPLIYSGINHFHKGMARMEKGSAFSNTLVYINTKGEVVWKEE